MSSQLYNKNRKHALNWNIIYETVFLISVNIYKIFLELNEILVFFHTCRHNFLGEKLTIFHTDFLFFLKSVNCFNLSFWFLSKKRGHFCKIDTKWKIGKSTVKWQENDGPRAPWPLSRIIFEIHLIYISQNSFNFAFYTIVLQIKDPCKRAPCV